MEESSMRQAFWATNAKLKQLKRTDRIIKEFLNQPNPYAQTSPDGEGAAGYEAARQVLRYLLSTEEEYK
jgi:hypothetical protein